jgi:uncharacterized protein YjbJ (UPF0337 family)
MAEIRKKYDGSVTEEASAIGERAKGAVKEGWGAITGDRDLENRGEAENAEGRARQASNQVFGTFRDRDSAERAYNQLGSRGYTDKDVNLMMSDETRRKYFSDQNTELGTKAMEGAGAGAAIGGTTVGVLGALAALGTSVALPGLGLVLAGPLVAGLAGAGAGGIAGGLIGSLIGWGIPEDHAKRYEKELKDGGIVMGVTPRNEEDAKYFRSEWERY